MQHFWRQAAVTGQRVHHSVAETFFHMRFRHRSGQTGGDQGDQDGYREADKQWVHFAPENESRAEVAEDMGASEDGIADK